MISQIILTKAKATLKELSIQSKISANKQKWKRSRTIANDRFHFFISRNLQIKILLIKPAQRTSTLVQKIFRHSASASNLKRFFIDHMP